MVTLLGPCEEQVLPIQQPYELGSRGDVAATPDGHDVLLRAPTQHGYLSPRPPATSASDLPRARGCNVPSVQWTSSSLPLPPLQPRPSHAGLTPEPASTAFGRLSQGSPAASAAAQGARGPDAAATCFALWSSECELPALPSSDRSPRTAEPWALPALSPRDATAAPGPGPGRASSQLASCGTGRATEHTAASSGLGVPSAALPLGGAWADTTPESLMPPAPSDPRAACNEEAQKMVRALSGSSPALWVRPGPVPALPPRTTRWADGSVEVWREVFDDGAPPPF